MPEPIVKIAGGKRQLLEQLKPFWPSTYQDYHEPFFGGGAVFFSLSPTYSSYLSDSNERLIRMYQGIRDHCDEVVSRLAKLQSANGRWPDLPHKLDSARVKEAYLKHLRKMFDEHRALSRAVGGLPLGLDVDQTSDATMAVWYIVMNRLGYNGMYRVNSKNEFNVPFGKFTGIPRLLFADELHAVSAALRSTVLRAADFRESLKGVEKHDLVFCDSPYAPVSKTSDFTTYTQEGFSVSDQIDLVVAAEKLVTEKGAYVRLTNSAALWLRAIYENYGFRSFALSARRSVNSDTTKRGSVVEHLFVHASQVIEAAMGEPLPALNHDQHALAHTELMRLLDLHTKNEMRKGKKKSTKAA